MEPFGFIRVVTSLIAPLVLAMSVSGFAAANEVGFPRLLGMNIGAKTYHEAHYQKELARLDVVILGFYRGWNPANRPEPIREVVRELKRLNPSLLVGQYTVLNELNDDPKNVAIEDIRYKLHRENWWLRKSDGSRVQWTSAYNAWEINITEWTKPDFNNQRYPQWLAQRDYRVFFEPVPEFDIWYFDNVMAQQRIGAADWDRDGKDESGKDPRIQQAFRRGQADHWQKAKALAPKLLLMGNADNDLSFPEYKGKLGGVFLEGMMGYRWSPEIQEGWEKTMVRYHTVFDNSLPPRLVGFNVAGKFNDWRFFRYAFATCLLNDGYFSYTDEAKDGSVPWFDEYEIKLGKAIDPPQKAPWMRGVYRRRFVNGMALVNPAGSSAAVTVESGYRRIKGRQDPVANDGTIAGVIVLPPKAGLILVRQ